MEEVALDFLLVLLGLCFLATYHLWLVLTTYQNPRRTVIGLNAESRRQWVFCMMVIRFYCLRNQGSGASFMAKAAIKSHAPALYSLAVIQFNGRGGSKSDKDLQAGEALCARAAFLGHVDALRELGHCFQDGYDVRQNSDEGRSLLIQANA